MALAPGSNCENPITLLQDCSRTVSQRKLRLFAVTCCQSVADLIREEGLHSALDVAWNFANDLSYDEARRNASNLIQQMPAYRLLNYQWLNQRSMIQHYLAQAVFASVQVDSLLAAREASIYAAQAAEAAESCGLWPISPRIDPRPLDQRSEPFTEKIRQTAWLQEIIGDPQRVIEIEDSWLSWNDETVPKMAQWIENERCFDDLPFLGDALEEAGCNDQAILNHCRVPQEHLPGCWLIDALLSRE